jgi:hypothetical protein
MKSKITVICILAILLMGFSCYSQSASAPLSASITSSSDVSCYLVSDGAATVTAMGGTSPYTYQWMPSGGTNAITSALSAGSYSVVVTDYLGNMDTVTTTISQPSLLIATMGNPTNALCHGGSSGSATVTAGGGTSPYTYTWTP